MIQNPADLVQMIRDAAELAHAWQPEHPQYIEGRFYLTSEQWAAVRTEWPRVPDRNQAQALWGIPVEIIAPNDVVRLPSGKLLVYSAALQALFVFPDFITRDALSGWR